MPGNEARCGVTATLQWSAEYSDSDQLRSVEYDYMENPSEPTWRTPAIRFLGVDAYTEMGTYSGQQSIVLFFGLIPANTVTN